ncbi:MAG: Rab family GTPase [Candidatus Asgardarchaeia archaeon]
MQSSKYSVYKVSLVGSTHVGKTTLQQRVVKGKFFETIERTVGVTFESKEFVKDGKQIVLQIWDFGGQLQYENIAKLLITGSNVVLYIFDLTRPVTLIELENIWIPLGRKYAAKDAISVLVGNKADLPKRVSSDQIEQVSKKHSLPYYETSAKTGFGLKELFNHIVLQLLEKGKKKVSFDISF